MAYSLQQLSDMMDALTQRVNTIDGQNLPTSQQSAIAQLNARITGLKSDLSQLSLLFENQLNLINTSMTNLKTQIQTLTTNAQNTQ